MCLLGPSGGDFSSGFENDDRGSKPDNQHGCKEATFTSIDLGSFLNQIVEDSKTDACFVCDSHI